MRLSLLQEDSSPRGKKEDHIKSREDLGAEDLMSQDKERRDDQERRHWKGEWQRNGDPANTCDTKKANKYVVTLPEPHAVNTEA